MKRDNELQKLVTHTSIWLGKRESNSCIEMYGAQKAKGLFSILKYQKFHSPISKWDVLLKNNQMLWFVKKPNEKLWRYVIIFLWEVIYVYFYNWDRPLDLVLVVYDLIELIIEASLWSKDYSTLDSHTQHTRLMFYEYLFHLCDCTCSNVMCVCSTICGSNQKDFLFFLFAFGSDLYHPCFSKFFKLFLCEKHVFWVFSWPISCVSSTRS